jgi:hypothetical protein
LLLYFSQAAAATKLLLNLARKLEPPTKAVTQVGSNRLYHIFIHAARQPELPSR